jgi:very-short-patch-repair endonuclease
MRAPSRTHRVAKSRLRGQLSLPEKLLWRRLKTSGGGDGPRFRRQHPVGPYILDFFCASARLCVEIDGWAHGTDDRPERDDRRDRYLGELGIHVERIAARTVLEDPDAVAAWMRQLAKELMGRPLSQLR